LVDIDGTFSVGDKKLRVAKTEHAQRPETENPLSDLAEMCLRFWRVGTEFRNRPGLLLVECENLDSFLGRDGEGGMEQVDAVAFSRNVELVVFAEELGLSAARAEKPATTRRGLLKNGLEDLLLLTNLPMKRKMYNKP
jgi:hypothetical protein